MSAVVEELSDLAADYDEELVASTVRRLFELQERAGKTCSSCGERKILPAFGKDPVRPDGLDVRCLKCNADRRRAARAARSV